MPNRIILYRTDFRLLEEIFDACDTLRRAHDSIGTSADDIIDTILVHTDISRWKVQSKEASSKLFRIEVFKYKVT